MRARLSLPLFLFLQAAAPQAPVEPPLAPEIALERRLAALVDEAAMQKEVRELCKLGPRMGGTESGEKSAKYIEERFKALGLDVRVLVDPPKWCHAESSWSVVAVRGDERHALASAWPYGFSPSAKGRAVLDEAASANAVLVSERTPKTIDAKYKVVLVTANTTIDGSYPRVSHLKEGDANPAPVFGLSRADKEWLEAARAAGGKIEIEFALEAKIQKASPRTVEARIPMRGSSAAPWTEGTLGVMAAPKA